MRTAFIETLCELAGQEERIWLLTGDLGYSVLERFAERFPERYINVGVAEQNMTGVAAGLALEGKIVFTYSIANFPIMRCLEQIRNDVCYHRLNVKIVAVGGGFAYGSAGYTHHGVEDIAVMRAMPNMTVFSPGDPVEVRLATRTIVRIAGPCYMRLGKGGEESVHRKTPEFSPGKGIWIRRGNDVTLIVSGAVLAEAVKAADLLKEQGFQAGVLSLPTIEPLDVEAVHIAAEHSGALIVIEEHSRKGGLGEAVSYSLASLHPATKPIVFMNLAESADPRVGSQVYLRRLHGLNVDHIYRKTIDAIGHRSK